VFGVPAIAFKGSGFYATDHGKKAKRSSETTEKGESKDAKKERPSGDPKPEAPAKKESTGSAASKEGSAS
jgi:hypothetical protein